jgi:acyl-CoA thioesterase
MTDADTLARACADKMWALDNASQGLGMAIRDIAPGHAVMTMEVQPSMVNGHGLCHGGFIFTLADSAFAFACNTHNEMNVAQHCAVTFLRPARLGDILVAEAIERVREGRTGIYDVSVRALNGAVIAEFRGHSRTLGQQFFPEQTEGGA